VLVNPLDKIQHDLETGAVTPQQAAVYGVQAMFVDPGLPPSYQGDIDARRVVGNDTDKQLSRALDLYDTLTREQRAIVLPRLLPPAYVEWPPGMPLRPRGATTLRAGPSSRPTYLPPSAASLQWTYIESVSSGIRVWYEVDNPETLTMAQLTRTVLMDEVIPKLDAVMDPAPGCRADETRGRPPARRAARSPSSSPRATTARWP
jgi:hypothetical protein